MLARTVRVALDTLLLVAAAALGAWTSAPGAWTWTALCFSWAGGVLLLAPPVPRGLHDAGRGAELAAPLALLAGLSRVGPGPAPVVVGAVFVALLAGVWFLVFGAVVARTPRRLRRLLVARVVAWAAVASVGAGLGPWFAAGPFLLFVLVLVPEAPPGGAASRASASTGVRGGQPWLRLALHGLGWGSVVASVASVAWMG